MNQLTHNLTEYLPHRGKMLLLNQLAEIDEQHAVATVTIDSDSLFLTDKGVPASVGIEYMAQTVAAYSGAKCRKKGEAAKIGLLLGSRRYDSQIDYFQLGAELTITVSPRYMEDNTLGVFICRIECQGDIVVTAILNVLQPEKMEDYF